jgi:Siphovirus ReqiPepy6 Gp37-like protein
MTAAALPDVQLYIRDDSFQRVALLDEFTSLEVVARHNEVGSWRLSLDRRTSKAGLLANPGYGIEVVYDGSPQMSGPVTHHDRTRQQDSDQLVVAGVDDLVWLRRRRAHPCPTLSGPPYNTQTDDVRTGVCSTVLRAYVDLNLGPGAISPRRLPGLSLAADPLLGSTITGRARWQTLLELLAGLALAGGGLGLRLVAQAGSGIQFSSYAPADKSSTVVFSLELGTLGGYRYEAGAPEANYIYAAGSGEGTARTIREGQDPASIASWQRIEDFVDRRDTSVSAELDQEIAEQLADKAGPVGLSITPLDVPGRAYGVDYQLGDRVRVVIDDTPVDEVIREVRLVLTPTGPRVLAPQIGSPSRPPVVALIRGLARVGRRITNLERR